MALVDPQSITINGTTTSLPRVSSKNPGGGTYRSGDELIEVNIRTLYGSRVRHQINLIVQKFTTDPYKPAENRKVEGSVNLSLNYPNVGFTAAEKMYHYKGLEGLLNAGSYADLVKLVGGEV